MAALSAATAGLNAKVVFSDNFEAYQLGSSINGQMGWAADGSYKIVKSGSGQAVFSGRKVAEAAISHGFAAQEGTFYIGVDVNYSKSASNFFWIAATDAAGDDHTVGAVFGVKQEQDLVTLRVRETGSSTKNSRTSAYTNPSRMVMEITALAGRYTCKVWFDPSSSSDKPLQTVSGQMSADLLDTFYARRASVSHSAMTMDNLIIATTFEEAAAQSQ
ncbi:hypothetical protein [Coraliomargarita parva]|uniref:hypothetical protein n=1 Tax=Coraliomargarita parva TaxID=3014050 RepID=UPI0022B3BEB4|nr:hypothetical protein [Coraliomargarita parva]